MVRFLIQDSRPIHGSFGNVRFVPQRHWLFDKYFNRVRTHVSPEKTQPFLPPGSLPIFGHVTQLDLERFYLSTEALHKKHATRTLRLRLFGVEALHMRHPDDCRAILEDQSKSFAKVPGFQRLSSLLGNGLVSQVEIQKLPNCLL